MPELTANPNLPDPLVMMNGKPVTTADQWVSRRRNELKQLFQNHMIGRFPPAPTVSATTSFEDAEAYDGAATIKEVVLTLGDASAPTIHLLLATPNASSIPAATFVGPNFGGNHALTDSPQVALPEAWMPDWIDHQVNNRATDAGRGSRTDRFPIAAIIDRGYAVASFYHGDLDPDKPDFTDGVHPHFGPDPAERGPHDWGTLAAWAWGLQRAVDYLQTDPGVDPERIASVGHSRNGKVALFAAAFDERIALAIGHQSGCGGAAPSRGTVGESVKQINDMFPHWFCDDFKRFNDQPEMLPFDQHCLIALMAPRPVLLTNAVEDQWANPAGQFQMLQAADPVYRRLGADGLNADAMPELNHLVDSPLGFWIRPGGHSMGPADWTAFMDFADKWL